MTEKRKEVDVTSEVMELRAIVNVILQTQARILSHLESRSDKDLNQELYNEVAQIKQMLSHNMFGS